MRKFHPLSYFLLLTFLAVSTAGCEIGMTIIEAVANTVQKGEEVEESRQAYHERRLKELDGPGWTDLHRAAAQGDVATVQTILDQRSLLVVEINPEVRVKIRRGPAPAAQKR